MLVKGLDCVTPQLHFSWPDLFLKEAVFKNEKKKKLNKYQAASQKQQIPQK